MAFRNPTPPSTGGSGPAVGTPTKAVDIGDVFEQGASGTYADAHHQHAVPGPAAGSAQPVNATGGDSSATDTAAARSKHSHAHTRAHHLAGGHADLTADFLTPVAGDGRYSPLVHGGRHARGAGDDLTGLFVPFDLVQGKGDQLVGAAANTLVRRPIGADGTVWTADAAAPGGTKWASPGSTAYDPVPFKIRKAASPDGLDLAGAAVGPATGAINPGFATFPTTTSVAIVGHRAWASGFLYTFGDTTLTFALATTSTKLAVIVVRINNAAGGPDTATLAIKESAEGAFTYPALQQDDLSASTTAIYEVEIGRFQISTTGPGAYADTRTFARGMDGQPGSVIKLAEILLGGLDTATLLQFSRIPLGFRDLRLSHTLRSNRAANTADVVGIRVNGDSGTNYVYSELLTTTAGVSASGSSAAGHAQAGQMPAADALANRMASGITELPDYSRNGIFRHGLSRAFNQDASTVGGHWLSQWQWVQQFAINDLRLFSTTGSAFVNKSRVALYGIR